MKMVGQSARNVGRINRPLTQLNPKNNYYNHNPCCENLNIHILCYVYILDNIKEKHKMVIKCIIRQYNINYSHVILTAQNCFGFSKNAPF